MKTMQQKGKEEARDTKGPQKVAKVQREKGQREDSLQQTHLPSIATGFTTRRVKNPKELAPTNTTKRSPVKRSKSC
jgi:hypothetical protein